MRAVVCSAPLPASDPAVFVWSDLPDPVAQGTDLLVRVKAVSVNPIDTKMRLAPLADGAGARVLGWDAAGIVEAVGPAATHFAVGDQVWYAGNVQRPGSNSELHLVDERMVGRMPSSLSFAQAAAMPLTALTAFEGLFEHLAIGAALFGLPPADPSYAAQNLLVIGGAGGVGSLAIQMGRLVPELTVVASASRQESHDWCLKMGAHHVVDHRGDLIAQCKVLGIANFNSMFLTRDPDAYFNTMARLCAAHGKICSIVDAQAPLPLMKLRARGGSFAWQAMFARGNLQSADITRQRDILNVTADWVDSGKIKCTQTRHFGTMDPENLRQAHLAIEAGSMIGKGVLTWSDS